jgi:hypothetical protein
VDQLLIDHYHRHVGMGFDRQLRLAEFLERKADGEDWAYDPATATLSFGPKVKFEAPVLGSHADHNNSWLWAWSNRDLKLTLTNRALGDAVRSLVHRLGVHALGAHGFALEPLLGPDLTEHAAHVLGIILGAELGYDAYYTAPYPGGRALVLIRDDRLRFTERTPLRRILTVFPKVISGLPVFDHREALSSYAEAYGVAVAGVPGSVKLTAGKDELTARFDDRGRLTELSGTVTPETKPVKKPTPKPVKKAAKKVVKKPARTVVKKAAAPAKKKAAAPAKKTGRKPPAKPAKKATKAVTKKVGKAATKKPARAAAKPGKKR